MAMGCRDSFWALAWVGDSNHDYNPNGGYAWFNMWDTTRRQGVLVGLALNGTFYYGYEAEWIMERPCLNVRNGQCTQFAQLSDYSVALMSNPEILSSSFNWYYYPSYSNEEMWMYNDYLAGNDNNLLSAAAGSSSTSIYYYWYNFH
jgi:hypothetical protein